MRPPEAAMARARDIFGGVCFRVVMTMIRDPRHWLARCVENRKEYQNILHHSIQTQGAVREASVIAYRGSNPAD
jgi:hypothetical protein